MKNIVACVDFSQTTSAVVEAALSLATAFHSKVYLVNAVVIDMNGIGYDGWIIPEYPEGRIAAARKALNDLRDPLLEHGIDVSTVLLEETGNSVRALLAEAERLDAGVIVAGSHGHGAFYSIVLGSTSEGLVRHAKCPVLVVPAQRPAEHEICSVRSTLTAK